MTRSRDIYNQKVCSLLSHAVKYGQHCPICGTKQNLTFHHLDPSTKYKRRRGGNRNGFEKRGGTRGGSGVVQVIRDWGSIRKTVEEMEKCSVVCHSCHNEINAGNVPAWELERMKPIKLEPEWVRAAVKTIREHLDQLPEFQEERDYTYHGYQRDPQHIY